MRARSRAGQRGESPLWSVAMITAVVALIGVSTLAVWVARRGGQLDVPTEAVLGIGRAGRAWAAVAAGSASSPAAAPDAGAPEPSAAASSEPSPDAGATEEPSAALDPDAGAEVEEEDPTPGPSVTPQTPGKPPLKKKKIVVKRPRRR